MPYKLRLGGTSKFVSKIDPDDPSCVPPGSIETVDGWKAPCLIYDRETDAQKACEVVLDIEGFHCTVEWCRKYADFGYANGWLSDPDEVALCKRLDHTTTDTDCGPPHRGMDHVVRCDVCKIVWHYDSSD